MQARVPKFTANKTTLCILCTFKDDLSPLSRVSGAQILLSQCITADKRADKSCSFVKGRSMNTTSSVSKASDHPEASSSIPSICSRPVKFLGRIIDGSISYRTSSAKLKAKLLEVLSVIDKSNSTGTQKL